LFSPSETKHGALRSLDRSRDSGEERDGSWTGLASAGRKNVSGHGGELYAIGVRCCPEAGTRNSPNLGIGFLSGPIKALDAPKSLKTGGSTVSIFFGMRFQMGQENQALHGGCWDQFPRRTKKKAASYDSLRKSRPSLARGRVLEGDSRAHFRGEKLGNARGPVAKTETDRGHTTMGQNGSQSQGVDTKDGIYASGRRRWGWEAGWSEWETLAAVRGKLRKALSRNAHTNAPPTMVTALALYCDFLAEPVLTEERGTSAQEKLRVVTAASWPPFGKALAGLNSGAWNFRPAPFLGDTRRLVEALPGTRLTKSAGRLVT